jgi:dephospho-CoA kinase
MDLRSSILDPRSSKPVVGLIGGIGSGKSQVAAAFARHGAYLISGDQLGHEALGQPDIKAQIVRRFGPGVAEEAGNISRRRLGALVFADPAQRQALEELVFPWIERRIGEEVAAARADTNLDLIILDAAILLEAGWRKWCDWVIYVHAPREARLRRLADQRGWSAKEVAARESAQLSLTDKVTRADFVVDNSGPPEGLGRQVQTLLRTWGLAPGQCPPPASASLKA